MVQYSIGDAGLTLILPHLVVQWLSAGVNALTDDIAELEVQLVNHAVCSVDDTLLDGVELSTDEIGDELELDSHSILQFHQHGFIQKFGIVENILVAIHLAHLLLK